MWRARYSPTYHMLSEWRPVFPLAGMSSAGGSQTPQAGPLAKKLLKGSLLEPIMGCWQALTQNSIPRTQKTTLKWRKRRRKGYCTEWPRFTSLWRCGRAAKTYVLPRRNLALTHGREWPRSVVVWSCHHYAHCYGFESWCHSSTRADSLWRTSWCRIIR